MKYYFFFKILLINFWLDLQIQDKLPVWKVMALSSLPWALTTSLSPQRLRTRVLQEDMLKLTGLSS